MNQPDTDSPISSGPRLRVRRRGTDERVSLWKYLTPADADQAVQDANQWIKALRCLRVDGVPFRDRFTYRGDSLWWFAEVYLHKTQAIATTFAALSAFEALIGPEPPVEIEWLDGDSTVRLAVGQAAKARGVRFVDRTHREFNDWSATIAERIRAHYYVTGSRLARRWVSTGAAPRSSTTVAAFVHTAFLQAATGDDVYIGAVLKELADRLAEDFHAIGIGPSTNFRARGWQRRLAELRDRLPAHATCTPIEAYAPRSAIDPSLEIWRARRSIRRSFTTSEDIRAASIVRGCDIWPIVMTELDGVADLQFPWSAQAMDEAGAALDTLKPKAIVTYAEAGGWGRAIALEARRRGIPFIGLQHGFIYRDWLNYRHEIDEMAPSAVNPSDRGFPTPTLTLVHDGLAADHLREAGNFPAGAVRITGSPRLDAIARTAGRLSADDLDRVRLSVGATSQQRLAIVASKFSQIGSAFPALVAEIRSMPDVQLVVKCHPAETPDPYLRAAGDARNVRVAPATADLGELIAACRLIITVHSTAAIEALFLGVPALVVNLPSNLSPFVAAGVMAGASGAEEIGPAVRGLLYDENQRASLARLRQGFLTAHHIEADGHAAERAAEAILSVAKGT